MGKSIFLGSVHSRLANGVVARIGLHATTPRHIAASNEGLTVGRPVRNAVLRLIRGMDLRPHPRSVAPAEGPEKSGPSRLTRRRSSCNNATGRADAAKHGHARDGSSSATRSWPAERVLHATSLAGEPRGRAASTTHRTRRSAPQTTADFGHQSRSLVVLLFTLDAGPGPVCGPSHRQHPGLRPRPRPARRSAAG